VQDYARVIRTDPAICGRVLRLANSAMFAQRSPVTTLERACLVLGLERLKSVSMGFYLSRAAACGPRDLSRQVWGHSVLRGCIAAEAARAIAPGHVPEAFVIGLMADAGVPLMPRLIGDEYVDLFNQTKAPGRLYRLECESLPFSHVDVITALARRWKFPDLLAKPLAWHHTRPGDGTPADTVGRLHRVAYVVGLLELSDDATPIDPEDPGVAAAARLLNLSHDEARGVVERSVREYGATISLFSEVASSLGDADTLIDRVQRGLVEAVDRAVQQQLDREREASPARLVLGGQTIEVSREPDGTLVAFLFDSRGQRLVCHRLHTRAVTAEEIADGLGLEVTSAEETARLAAYVRSLAA
jgi:HD-like signal output (HDOD) protein